MAITTLDGIVAGYQQPVYVFKVGATMEAAGQPHTFLYSSGMPGSATANTEAIAGVALTSLAGQIPFTNPSSGNAYLSKHVVASTQTGSFLMIDRLWHNSSMAETSTSSQTVNSAAWPARDANGSTNGEGVMIALEVSTATTNGSQQTATVTYTNQAGTGSKTGTITIPATAVAGTFCPMSLAAGDTGVRSIQSIQFSATLGTGVTHLVAYRVIDGPLAILAANQGNQSDFVGTGMVRCYDNTVPQIVFTPGNTTATTIHCIYQWVHG